MKLIFKKMILASVLSLAGITYAQYYPNDNYGNNQYGNNSYEYYYDDYNYKGAKNFIPSLTISNYIGANETPTYLHNVRSLVTGTKVELL